MLTLTVAIYTPQKLHFVLEKIHKVPRNIAKLNLSHKKERREEAEKTPPSSDWQELKIKSKNTLSK